MNLTFRLNRLSFLLSILFLITACNNQSPNSKNLNLTASEFAEKIKTFPDAKIIDVRTPEEFGKGHLLNAINYDWNGNGFDQEISKLDKSKPVFVYCLSGGRSGSAAEKMRADGFSEVYELDGGIIKWRAENLAETTDNKINPTGYSLEDFQKMLVSDKMVLVDFYADWCEPCIKMKPFLEEIALEQSSKLTIIRINADDNQSLLKALNIEGLPELQLYNNNSKKWSQNGFVSKEDILKQLQ